MEKKVDFTSFNLNIHSIIKVNAPDMPQNISRYLSRRFSLFTVGNECVEGEKADILMMRLKHTPVRTSTGDHMNLLYGFWITGYEGRHAIVFNYKGKPDIVLSISDNIKIFYSNRKRAANKLYGLLLYCINVALNKKNGLLFHGTMVKNENNHILFVGHRGAKKTLLLLKMLSDGWDYLSEDKVVMHNNNTYLFQDFIVVRNHHLELLPWFANAVQEKKGLKKWSPLRKKIRMFSQKHFPKYVHSVIEKYCNPLININVNTIFPSAQIIQSAKPSIVIVMFTGSEFEFVAASKNDMIESISSNQRILFNNCSMFENLLNFYNGKSEYNLNKVISDNLNDQTFFKLTIPGDCEIEWLYQKIKHCLSRL